MHQSGWPDRTHPLRLTVKKLSEELFEGQFIKYGSCKSGMTLENIANFFRSWALMILYSFNR